MTPLLLTVLYSPSWNSVTLNSGDIGSAHIWVYGYIAFCLIIVLAMRVFPFYRRPRFSVRSIIRKVTLGAFFVLLIAQIYSQHRYLASLEKNYADKSVKQKYLMIYGGSFHFTQVALAHLKSPCHGILITDLVFSETLEPFILKYFLYPKINLLDQSDQVACLVIYDKLDPERFVPNDFKIALSYDSKSLLAVKK